MELVGTWIGAEANLPLKLSEFLNGGLLTPVNKCHLRGLLYFIRPQNDHKTSILWLHESFASRH